MKTLEILINAFFIIIQSQAYGGQRGDYGGLDENDALGLISLMLGSQFMEDIWKDQEMWLYEKSCILGVGFKVAKTHVICS